MKSERFEVYVWVFTKGWVQVGGYKEASRALKRASEFLPLEVKISTPDRGDYWGGYPVSDMRWDLERGSLDSFANHHDVDLAE